MNNLPYACDGSNPREISIYLSYPRDIPGTLIYQGYPRDMNYLPYACDGSYLREL